MKRTRSNEEQMIGAVKQLEAGRAAAEIALGAYRSRRCITGERSTAGWK